MVGEQTTICTLFEGNYHLGLAALANSLHRSGFCGDLFVGHRGPIPPWASDHTDFDLENLSLPVGDVNLHFRTIEADGHLTLYKAIFMTDVLSESPTTDFIVYLDPDIVVKAPWDVLVYWFTRDSISLVEDVNSNMPRGHPKRRMWNEFLATNGYESARQLDRYYNAGFVGLHRTNTSFLNLWLELCSLATISQGASKFKYDDPSHIFHSSDQDLLNCALSMTQLEINAAGPESMDFDHGGYLLSHAVGSPKPWMANYLAQALHGVSPTLAHKNYHEYLDGPIIPFSRAQRWRRRWSIRAASAIGRFYSKNN